MKRVLALSVLAVGCASQAPVAHPSDATSSTVETPASAPSSAPSSAPPSAPPTTAAPIPSAAPASPSATASAAAAPTDQADAKVLVTKAGKLMLDGVFVADERELTTKVKVMVAKSPDLRVVIYADKDLPYARVVRILDALKAAGVQRVAVAVEAAS